MAFEIKMVIETGVQQMFIAIVNLMILDNVRVIDLGYFRGKYSYY